MHSLSFLKALPFLLVLPTTILSAAAPQAANLAPEAGNGAAPQTADLAPGASDPEPKDADPGAPPRRSEYVIKAANISSFPVGTGPGPLGYPAVGYRNSMNITVSGWDKGNTDQHCYGDWFHPADLTGGEFHQLKCPDPAVRVDMWQTGQKLSGDENEKERFNVLTFNLGVAVE
ncbi:MAG: hypothetical protein Q9168_007970 [Polycauliona sp. 1 TL-2023]